MQQTDITHDPDVGDTADTVRSARSYPDLTSLFHPRSVALVGATERSMWSVNAFQNLRRFSPEVELHCISPTRDTVHGVPAARSLTALDRPVDLAYVMSPRETVVDVLREAAAIGTTSAIVLTAGFGEMEDGRGHQQALVEVSRETGIQILGPNGSGFVDIGHGFMPFGLALPPLPDPGRASFLLQSGGLMKPLLGLARSWGVGVAKLAGTGNEAVLTVSDVARYVIEEPDTGAIGMFVEAFRDVEGFRALAARAIELDRPLVVLPVGRSEVARRSAQSHTGALAGNSEVTSAVLRALGVVEVRTLEELVSTTELLARGVRPRGGRLAVVSASGGSCELIADKAADEGLPVPELPPAAEAAIGALLPDFSQVHNPLDVTGYATVDPTLPIRAAESLGTTAADAYDVLLFQAFVTPGEDPPNPDAVRAHFTSIAEAATHSEMSLLLQDEVGTGTSDFARRLFDDVGLVRLPGVETGVGAVANAVRYVARREEIRSRTEAQSPAMEPPATLEDVGLGNGPLSEGDGLAALQRLGVPTVPHRLARSTVDAVAAAAEIGGSVVLKASSPDIAHKSDIGAVVLDVSGGDAVSAAYVQVMDALTQNVPNARIDGILVAPFRQGGVELVVGLHRDPVWGPVLMLGMGGVLVELLADVVIRPLPVSTADIGDMLLELRGAPLLRGVRGSEPVDIDAVATAVSAIAGAAGAWGDTWSSVEVNPLRVQGTRVEALDALVIPTGPHDRTAEASRRNS